MAHVQKRVINTITPVQAMLSMAKAVNMANVANAANVVNVVTIPVKHTEQFTMAQYKELRPKLWLLDV